MNKLFILLALMASPVFAEPVMPGPDASYEERREYMNQIHAEAAEKHKQAVAESEQRLRDFNVKVGLPADYQTYGSGRGCRYSCVTTVIANGKVYRFQVSTR